MSEFADSGVTALLVGVVVVLARLIEKMWLKKNGHNPGNHNGAIVKAIEKGFAEQKERDKETQSKLADLGRCLDRLLIYVEELRKE